MSNNIKTYLAQIKKAVYGKDVRSAIYNAIKQCYRDAIDADNTNMEVVEARGNYSTLNERLQALAASTSTNNDLTLEEININDVVINLRDGIFYECKEDINSFEVNNTENNVNFKSFLVFETGEIKYTNTIQNNIIFTGDNCSSGQLILVKNTLYFIEFNYLRSNNLIGKVLCYSEGDTGDNTTDTEIKDFAGAQDMINIAMSYFNARDKYITYGQTNILSNSGNYDWSKVTVTGADSPDGRYRKLDCSALIGLVVRGIQFSEVLLNETVYKSKDLSARTTLYDWATELPRTAAEMLRKVEELGWILPSSDWHTYGTNDWAGLKPGDIYFLGGANNDRYKGVYHVGLYIGEYTSSTGEQKICILDCSSNEAISKHSDNKIKAVRILSFDKIDKNAIVGIARIQVA